MHLLREAVTEIIAISPGLNSTQIGKKLGINADERAGQQGWITNRILAELEREKIVINRPVRAKENAWYSNQIK